MEGRLFVHASKKGAVGSLCTDLNTSDRQAMHVFCLSSVYLYPIQRNDSAKEHLAGITIGRKWRDCQKYAKFVTVNYRTEILGD